MEALSQIPAPVVVVLYEDRDISADLAPHFLSITYTDNLDGDQADSLEIEVEDVDGRWLNDWYPDAGARLDVKMGQEGAALLSCGSFEIDRIGFKPAPDTLTISALSAGVTKPLRTVRSAGYDQIDLATITRAVATRHGLAVQGDIEAISFERVTQHNENDLAFLRRIAAEYGYAVNVRGKVLTMYKQSTLRDASAVLTLLRGDGHRLSFDETIKDSPSSASVSHHNQKTKKLVSYDLDTDGRMVASPSADSIKLHGRVETKEHAKAKCEAALDAASARASTGSGQLYGDARLVAGINVDCQGWGHFDGKYIVAASRHTITRSGGYVTDIDLRRATVAPVQAAKSSKAGNKQASQPRKLVAYTIDKNGNTVSIPAGQR